MSNKFIVYLCVFGAGLGLGSGWDTSEPEKEYETVFIDKWKTREVVETKTKVVHKPMPKECEEVFTLLGSIQEPVRDLSDSAGDIKVYAEQLGVQAYDSNVPGINSITLLLREAKDTQGSAGVEVLKALDLINQQYLTCQQAYLEE